MKRELERIEIPDEHEARERAWAVVRGAFKEKVPAEPRRRYVRPALALAAVIALVAAALSPPGGAVLDGIRDAVGVERSAPALFSVPTRGQLLVRSQSGVWVVQSNGSRRLLGRYRQASWSPFGRFVAASRPNELAALEPDGEVRWTLARPDVGSPIWTGSETDTRIAYADRTGVHVVAGNGRGDRLLSPGPSGPLAWRPGAAFTLATLQGSELRLQDADSGRVLARANTGPSGDVLGVTWSRDGKLALIAHPWELDLVDPDRDTRRAIRLPGADALAAAFSPDGRHIAVLRPTELTLVDPRHPGAAPMRLFAGAGAFEGLTWSPDGRWLLVGWPAADQWVFVRADGKRIRAVSNVSGQFHSAFFPRVEGWCCGG